MLNVGHGIKGIEHFIKNNLFACYQPFNVSKFIYNQKMIAINWLVIQSI